MSKEFKLYIAKQGESIEEIASKFKLQVAEIIRYNPNLRYKALFGGEPLNIMVEKEEVRIKEYEKKDEKEKPCSLAYLMERYVWKIKEALFANVHFPKFSEPAKKTLKETIDDIAKFFIAEADKNPNQAIDIMTDYNEQILRFPTVAKTKDKLLIQTYRDDLKKKTGEILEKLKKINPIFQNPELQKLLYIIGDLFLQLTLSIMSLDFEKMEEFFKKLLDSFQKTF